MVPGKYNHWLGDPTEANTVTCHPVRQACDILPYAPQAKMLTFQHNKVVGSRYNVFT